MKATLKYITIKTNGIKPGYVVLHDNKFKTVVEIIEDHAWLTAFDKDTFNIEVPIKDIESKVVKFLAIVGNTTYSIIHGNFKDIANYFSANEELLQIFIDRKGSIEIDGRIKHILAYPVKDDVVELIDIKVSELHSVTEDKLDRIGVVKSIAGNRFEVDFRTFTQSLKRSQFKITTLNSKEVFELC